MKKLTIGIIIGLMLGLSTTTFAAIGDIVSAKFASFSYMVNGDSKAVDSPVLVYEGTSYLRTTDIGNLLGYDVVYKSDSRTIEFIKPEPITTPLPIQQAPNTDIITQPDSVTGEPITATPTNTPSPTPTPVVDNTAACQAIDQKYVMDIWNAEQRGKWTDAHYLKYYYNQEKQNAGC